jgi:hypothetical protein
VRRTTFFEDRVTLMTVQQTPHCVLRTTLSLSTHHTLLAGPAQEVHSVTATVPETFSKDGEATMQGRDEHTESSLEPKDVHKDVAQQHTVLTPFFEGPGNLQSFLAYDQGAGTGEGTGAPRVNLEWSQILLRQQGDLRRNNRPHVSVSLRQRTQEGNSKQASSQVAEYSQGKSGLVTSSVTRVCRRQQLTLRSQRVDPG